MDHLLGLCREAMTMLSEADVRLFCRNGASLALRACGYPKRRKARSLTSPRFSSAARASLPTHFPGHHYSSRTGGTVEPLNLRTLEP
jgi:hypothetical protein